MVYGGKEFIRPGCELGKIDKGNKRKRKPFGSKGLGKRKRAGEIMRRILNHFRIKRKRKHRQPDGAGVSLERV